VAEARVLRVVTFEPSASESALDAALRERALPSLLATKGCVDAWIGRHGAGDKERLIASTWTTPPADDVETKVLAGIELFGGTPSITSTRIRSICASARFDRPEPAQLLRVVHGRSLAGQLDVFVNAARQGLAATPPAGATGPTAFVLATEPPDDFTALTAWTDWASIEQATGGNVRRPATTPLVNLLADHRVVHYELLLGDTSTEGDRAGS
jgi:hypothetical protein